MVWEKLLPEGWVSILWFEWCWSASWKRQSQPDASKIIIAYPSSGSFISIWRSTFFYSTNYTEFFGSLLHLMTYYSTINLLTLHMDFFS